jgi:hypothetical protein
MRLKPALFAVATILFLPTLASAQVPFFNSGVSAFTPQIDVVNTGVLHDVQAVVSPDRKYVTLNMRPQSSALIALHEFSFQNPQLAGFAGFVGGVQFNAAAGAGQFGAVNPPIALGPANGEAILTQRGMTRILLK